MNRIEFGELRIGEKARKNLMDVCDSNWASAGPKVQEFEEKFKSLFGYKYAAAVSSGTDADINSFMALYEFGASRGDEVLTPALSFIATANAIRAAGFNPKFVEVKAETLNIDETKVEAAITDKTRAIVAVNTMGKPCNMQALREICDRHKLLLICDNCEGHGCKFDDKYMAHIADISTYSFYVAHLVCCGEGGMICTNREDIYESLISTRSHGRKNGALYFDHIRYGLNSKMNDLEASIGLEAVDVFWNTFHTRKNTYYRLMYELEDITDKCYFSEEDSNAVNCPHGFSFTLKEADPNLFNRFTGVFDKYNIHWKRNFGCIPTQHKCFEYLGYKLGDFPISEHIGNYGIHIGIHQHLKVEDIERIVTCSKEALKLL